VASPGVLRGIVMPREMQLAPFSIVLVVWLWVAVSPMIFVRFTVRLNQASGGRAQPPSQGIVHVVRSIAIAGIGELVYKIALLSRS
jgi:hypothetical protein